MFSRWFEYGLCPWDSCVIIPRGAIMPEWGWREKDQGQCEGKAVELWNLVELLFSHSLYGTFVLPGFGFYFPWQVCQSSLLHRSFPLSFYISWIFKWPLLVCRCLRSL